MARRSASRSPLENAKSALPAGTDDTRQLVDERDHVRSSPRGRRTPSGTSSALTVPELEAQLRHLPPGPASILGDSRRPRRPPRASAGPAQSRRRPCPCRDRGSPAQARRALLERGLEGASRSGLVIASQCGATSVECAPSSGRAATARGREPHDDVRVAAAPAARAGSLWQSEQDPDSAAGSGRASRPRSRRRSRRRRCRRRPSRGSGRPGVRRRTCARPSRNSARARHSARFGCRPRCRPPRDGPRQVQLHVAERVDVEHGRPIRCSPISGSRQVELHQVAAGDGRPELRRARRRARGARRPARRRRARGTSATPRGSAYSRFVDLVRLGDRRRTASPPGRADRCPAPRRAADRSRSATARRSVPTPGSTTARWTPSACTGRCSPARARPAGSCCAGIPCVMSMISHLGRDALDHPVADADEVVGAARSRSGK